MDFMESSGSAASKHGEKKKIADKRIIYMSTLKKDAQVEKVGEHGGVS